MGIGGDHPDNAASHLVSFHRHRCLLALAYSSSRTWFYAHSHPFCSAHRAASIRLFAPRISHGCREVIVNGPSDKINRAAISARLAPKSDAESTSRSRWVSRLVP